MTAPKWLWTQRDRQVFVGRVSATGDVALAAAAINRTPDEAYRMREAVPGFAMAWDRAIAIAWDQVETRVLAGLLARTEVAEPQDKDGKAPPVSNPKAKPGLIDSRLALAVLQRRPTARQVRGPVIDSARVAKLREEIRALAGG